MDELAGGKGASLMFKSGFDTGIKDLDSNGKVTNNIN
jgi:hypothetical protein